MEFDEVLKQFIGQLGVYQILLILFASSSCINFSINFMDVIFVGLTPEFRCDVLSSDVGGNDTVDSGVESNLTWDQLVQLTSPRLEDGTYDTCHYCTDHNYTTLTAGEAGDILSDVNYTCNSVAACSDWVYSEDFFSSTIVTEWDLVCDKKWYVATQQAVMMSGSMTVLIGGWLSDRYGRRPVMVCSLILHLLSRTAQGLAVNFYMFLVARFFLSAAALNLYTCAFTLSIEVVGPKWRVLAGQVPYVFTSIGYIILAGVAYFVRDWRTLSLVILIFGIPYISYACFLPESARWLISKHKHKKATSIIKSMAKVNSREVPSEVYEDLRVSMPEKGSIVELFRSGRMVTITLINSFLWFTCSMVYFGVSLFLPKLGGNIFISTIISGALELPALLYVQLTLNTFLGRRINSALTFSLCGVSFIILMLIPKDHIAIILVFALMGKFAIAAAFSIIYIHTSEMYPTSLRTVSLSVCSSVARFGMILAPYIAHLDNISSYLPPTVMAITAITAGGLSLILSETRGTNLPDTIANLNSKYCPEALTMDTKAPKDETTANLSLIHKTNIDGKC